MLIRLKKKSIIYEYVSLRQIRLKSAPALSRADTIQSDCLIQAYVNSDKDLYCSVIFESRITGAKNSVEYCLFNSFLESLIMPNFEVTLFFIEVNKSNTSSSLNSTRFIQPI